MTLKEIKIRQLTNQYLISPADKLTVVKDLCGLQAQFMVNAAHSLKIRSYDFNEENYGEGLVKNWTVRGTVHIFAESDLSLFINANGGEDYLKNEWSGKSFWNQHSSWALTPERQSYFTDVILNALKEKEFTREELKGICRENGMTVTEENSMFDPWGGGIRKLCERGFINYAVKEEKAFCLSPKYVPLSNEEAEKEKARRYFTNMGPATLHDAMYYFHTSMAKVKSWLKELPVKSIECEGKTYYYIENGKSYGDEIPEVLFLAGFDQLMLAYEKKESIYLKSEHLRKIFNLAGIVMPPLLINGEVKGKWKKKNNKLEIELFENISNAQKAALYEKAKTLWNDIKVKVKNENGNAELL